MKDKQSPDVFTYRQNLLVGMGIHVHLVSILAVMNHKMLYERLQSLGVTNNEPSK